MKIYSSRYPLNDVYAILRFLKGKDLWAKYRVSKSFPVYGYMRVLDYDARNVKCNILPDYETADPEYLSESAMKKMSNDVRYAEIRSRYGEIVFFVPIEPLTTEEIIELCDNKFTEWLFEEE